jgi:cGMP-dependent protein kinase
MVTILEILNTKRIILRDFKPSIFKIGEDGYPVLYKMPASKININLDSNMEFKTLIGTPHYTAPEIIAEKPYNYRVDLWGLGITLYEMICGVVPFGEDVDDPYEVYKIIMAGKKVQYPPILNKSSHTQAKNLIQQLLSFEPENRIPR